MFVDRDGRQLIEALSELCTRVQSLVESGIQRLVDCDCLNAATGGNYCGCTTSDPQDRERFVSPVEE